MPKLDEYHGKELLASCGIAVPAGRVAADPEEARAIADEIGRPVAVKAQVGVTGRFKAGGIKFADDAGAAADAAAEIIGSEIKGALVERVLVEERLGVAREFYAGLIVDDSCAVKGPVLIVSSRGGTGIEDIAAEDPEAVARLEIDILEGLTDRAAREAVARCGLPGELHDGATAIVTGLYRAFRQYDARSAEINPVIVTEDGDVIAGDCRFVIDEASLYRQEGLGIGYPRELGRPPTALERRAWEIERNDYRGVGYFAQMVRDFGPGEGVVGFHGIGGGGAMLGADALMRHGLKLANYADTSGNPTASKVYRVIKTIFEQPNIDAYVLMGACVANQEQWHHAHALVRALREELVDRPGFPVMLLLAGNKEAESLEILSEGLSAVPAEVEIYGRDHVYQVDALALRLCEMIEKAHGTASSGGRSSATPSSPGEGEGGTYRFPFATGEISIDHERCRACESYACVKACSLFGRSILRIDDGLPALVSDDAGKRCIEDLACEHHCRLRGNGGLRISLTEQGDE